MKLFLQISVLFLLLISCQNNQITGTNNIVYNKTIILDSIGGKDTISSYSDDHIVIYFSYHKPTQKSIGVYSFLDTTNFDTVKLVLSFCNYSVGDVNNNIQFDSLLLNPFYFDTTLKNHLNKYLLISDSSKHIYKTVFLSDSLFTQLPLLTDSNINQTIANSNEIIVLYIESRFCPPCVIYRPIFEEFANQYHDSGVTCYGVIYSNASIFCNNLDIRSTPRYVFIDSQTVVDELIGGNDLERLKSTLSTIKIKNAVAILKE
jgi:thiol-disulfide isomerase/thioredoxin